MPVAGASVGGAGGAGGAGGGGALENAGADASADGLAGALAGTWSADAAGEGASGASSGAAAASLRAAPGTARGIGGAAAGFTASPASATVASATGASAAPPLPPAGSRQPPKRQRPARLRRAPVPPLPAPARQPARPFAGRGPHRVRRSVGRRVSAHPWRPPLGFRSCGRLYRRARALRVLGFRAALLVPRHRRPPLLRPSRGAPAGRSPRARTDDVHITGKTRTLSSRFLWLPVDSCRARHGSQPLRPSSSTSAREVEVSPPLAVTTSQ